MVYAGMIPRGVTVEWIDPTGEVWNLTTGDKRVRLDLGQRGLHMAGIEFMFDDTGLVRRGVRRSRIEPTLAIMVGENLQGQRWYDLHTQWWGKANNPKRDGVLRVTHPDGRQRTLRARICEAPDPTFTYDPGLRYVDPPVESWCLQSQQVCWEGRTATTKFANNAAQLGAGWSVSNDVYEFRNPQWEFQGEVWPKYEFKGAFGSNVVGVEFGPVSGRKLRIVTGLSSNAHTLTIDTDPAKCSVIVNRGNGPEAGWEYVAGAMDPVPVGERVRFTIPPGVRAAREMTLSVTESLVTPF